MKIEIEIEIPEGWDYVGYDNPRKGDHYISEFTGKVEKAEYAYDHRRCFIVKKKAPVRRTFELVGYNKCLRVGYFYSVTQDSALNEIKCDLVSVYDRYIWKEIKE